METSSDTYYNCVSLIKWARDDRSDFRSYFTRLPPETLV